MNQHDEYTTLLRKHVLGKIASSWDQSKQISYGAKFTGVQNLPNKDAFYADLKEEIDEALKVQFGLDAASRRQISKDSIRRFLDENHDGGYSDKIKDAFAIYLGYDHFKDFCLAQNVPSISTKKSQRKAYSFGIGSVLILAFFGWLYFKFLKKPEEQMPYFQVLEADKLHYDEKIKVLVNLQGLTYEKALLEINGQVEFIEKKVDKMGFYANSPGIKNLHLRIDDKVVQSEKIYIPSDKWWASVNLTRPINQYPFIRDGYMSLPDEVIITNDEEQYGNFQLQKRFGLSGDEMIFETEVKNSKEMGSFWAYDVSINLEGELDHLSFNLLDPSASIYARMKVAKTILETPAERAKLAPLCIDLSDWRLIKVKTHNHLFQVFIDEKPAFEMPYKGEIGPLTGIHFYIKGRGAINSAKLSTLDGQVIFEDDFDR